MEMGFLEYLSWCLDRSVPIAAINTVDGVACHSLLMGGKEMDGFYSNLEYGFIWGPTNGLEHFYTSEARQKDGSFDGGEGLLEEAKQAVQSPFSTNPIYALQFIKYISDNVPNDSDGAVFVMFLSDRIVNNDNSDIMAIIYEILSIREILKRKNHMLILLGTQFNFPPELQDSIVTMTEPLPSFEDRKDMVTTGVQILNDKGKEVSYETDEVETLATALSGQSRFGAEQSLWLSAQDSGFNLEMALKKKYDMVSSTPGLTVFRSPSGFEGLGGLNTIKQYFTSLINGKMNTKAVILIDEIEKALGGSGGRTGQDSSGVSSNFLGSLLTFMQDKNCYGSLFTGIYGAGKSAVTKAIGKEAEAVTVQLDLSSMKGSLVGESEAKLRRALQVVESVAGDGDIMFVASCNRIEQLPPELRRRFNLGTFFFYFPDAEERATIWDIYMKKYSITNIGTQLVNDTNWTGAEIESCCRNADLMGVSLEQAAKYITPVCQTAKDEIAVLVNEANNRYLSTSYEGTFHIDKVRAMSQKGSESKNSRGVKF